MKANFDLVDSFAVSAGEFWADLHNDFDFDGVALDWAARTATLTWRRASGEWVPRETPHSLRMVFTNVTFLLMNLGSQQADSRTVDAAGYIRSDAPATEQGFLPHRREQSDHLVLIFGNGGYFRIYAESSILEYAR
jgi:hypothetical protein